MATAIIIITAALLLLAPFLYLEVKDHRAKIPVKAVLSTLFIVTALLHSPSSSTGFYPSLIVGLALCLAGDLLLALKGKKPFMAGLVAFLLGHVAYIVAFMQLTSYSHATWMGAAPTILFSGAVFLWLRPHLGKMLGPVAAYVVAITIMVFVAWMVFFDSSIPFAGRLAILVGAVLFYFSDIFVARHRFIEESHWNRLIGLPLYYSGQFVLAFSPSLLS